MAAEEGEPSEFDDGRTEIPLADDGTAGEIGAEVGPEETYPGARAADEAEAEPEAEVAEPEPEREPAAAPAGDGRTRDGGERVKASPLARRLAGELGRGHRRACAAPAPTGASCAPTSRRPPAATRARAGRATGARRRRPRRRRPAAEAPAPERREAAPGERVPLTRLQRTIAARMVASIDGGAAVRARTRRGRDRGRRPAPPAGRGRA